MSLRIAFAAWVALGAWGCSPTAEPTENLASIGQPALVAIPEARLQPGQAQAQDLFGSVVLTAGDAALVTAPGRDSDDANSGGAWVLRRRGGLEQDSWLQEATLVPADEGVDNQAGFRAAFDGSTAVLASAWNDRTPSLVVFERDADGAWSQTALIAGDDDQHRAIALSGDTLASATTREGPDEIVFYSRADGWQQVGSLDTSPDVNDFSLETLALSSSHLALGGVGSVLVYAREGGSWSFLQEILGDDVGHDFGGSIALEGSRLVVGTPEGALVYETTGGAFALAATLNPERPWLALPFEQNETAVALRDDVVLLGKPAAARQGVVFRDNGLTWVEVADLSTLGESGGASIGRSAAISFDEGGDPVLLLGAPESDRAALNAGAVYGFSFSEEGIAGGASDVVTEAAILFAGGSVAGDQFGGPVLLGDDVVLATARGRQDPSTVTEQDLPYVSFYGLGALGWRQEVKISAELDEFGGRFGTALALDGDTALVGISEVTGGAPQEGAVAVLERDDAGWSRTTTLRPDAARENGLFGYSVALEGDTALIGSGPSGVAGSVHVYERVDGAWSQSQVLEASDARSDDVFGLSLALEGDTLVVGASPDGLGVAHVFTRADGGTWSEQQVLRADAAEEQLGGIIALSGDTLALGCVDRAYLYHRDDTGNFVEEARIEHGLDVAVALRNLALDGERLAIASGTPVRVTVYERRGGSWEEQVSVLTEDQTDFEFGHPLSLRGSRLALGEPNADDRGERSGAINLYSLRVTGSECRDDLTLLTGEGQISCAPYRCQAGACVTRCESTADCAPGNSCSAAGECIPIAETAATAQSNDGCGCRLPGHSQSRGTLLGLFVTLGALLTRRRKAAARAEARDGIAR